MKQNQNSESPPIQDNAVNTADSFPKDRAEKYSVLLIDDDIDQLELFTMFLKKSGYIVTAASSVAEAQSMMAMRYYDIVVSDLMMPQQSGTDLINWLRSLKTFPSGIKIPVILLSASNPDIEGGLPNFGADMFCQKQFAQDKLLQQMQSLLRR